MKNPAVKVEVSTVAEDLAARTTQTIDRGGTGAGGTVSALPECEPG